MNPPSDLSQLLALLLAQLAPLAPFLVSGATLSHIIAQWDIIKNEKTPDPVKILIALGVAFVGTFLANLFTGAYGGGAAWTVYVVNTIQQTGQLFMTMTIANVGMDKLLPNIFNWLADTVTRLVVAVRKGVDTLLNGGQPPTADTQAA